MRLKLSKHRLQHVYLPPFVCEFNINNLIWQVESSFLTANISSHEHFEILEVRYCRSLYRFYPFFFFFFWEAGLFPSSQFCLFSSGSGHFCPFPSTEPVPTGRYFEGCPHNSYQAGLFARASKTEHYPRVLMPLVDSAWKPLEVIIFCALEKTPCGHFFIQNIWLACKKSHKSYSWQRNLRVFPDSQSNSSLSFIKFWN